MATSLKHASRQCGSTGPDVALFMLVAVLLNVLGCGPGEPSREITASFKPLPSGCPANQAPSDTAQLRACIDGLVFDTVAALGDEQRLMVRGPLPGPACHGDPTHSCRYGPLAKIEPAKGAHELGDSALNEGRIIARLFLRSGESEHYPKFGLLPNDTTYWWVRTGVDSSIFLTKSGDGLVITRRSLERVLHPDSTFHQAVARWIWVEDDEKTQGSCGSGCCR